MKRKGSQNTSIDLYFITELCSLAGHDDETVKDKQFMPELTKYKM